MSPEQLYAEWKRKPHIGCQFARLIARSPAEHGQLVERLPCDGTANEVAVRIADRIAALIPVPEVTASAILLPELDSLRRLTEVMLALDGQPGWTVARVPLDNFPTAEMVAIRIAKQIPFQGASCPSEALVFGPFEEFPNTRQAPLSAFELFVGVPMDHDPKAPEVPTTKANFAHMRLQYPSEETHQKMWDASMAGRTKSLGGDDSRAKAKNSFVIPAALARELGCMP